MKRKLLLLTLLLTLLLANAAQAMSSANYSLDWLVPLSGGGGTAASANFAASYTIGQSFIGGLHSSQYKLSLGFWQEFFDQIFVWLPLVKK